MSLALSVKIFNGYETVAEDAWQHNLTPFAVMNSLDKAEKVQIPFKTSKWLCDSIKVVLFYDILFPVTAWFMEGFTLWHVRLLVYWIELQFFMKKKFYNPVKTFSIKPKAAAEISSNACGCPERRRLNWLCV